MQNMAAQLTGNAALFIRALNRLNVTCPVFKRRESNEVDALAWEHFVRTHLNFRSR